MTKRESSDPAYFWR